MNDKNKKAVVRRDENLPRKKNAITVAHGRAVDKIREKDRAWDNERGLQRVRHGVDRPLLIIILTLICMGAVTVFSASYPTSGTSEIKKHLLFLAIGAVAMIVCMVTPYSAFRPAAIVGSGISLVLLVLVLIIGTARGAAKRWINITSTVNIQPSEVAKLALVLLLAWYLDRHYEDINSLNNKKKLIHGIAVPGAIMAVFCGLVLLEKHLSGTIILALIGCCIIYLSGASIKHMLLCYGVPGVAACGIFLLTNSYALDRIKTFTDKEANQMDEAWQTTQGLRAIGNGGLMGTGIGNSNMKHAYVSEAQNDFIFSIWCEEMGYIGAVLLIVLFGLFVWRGMVIARRAPDTFSSLTAFGITIKVAIQTILNMFVVTDMIFNTGVSLPFFSSGGSAIIMQLLEMGILLSISRHSYQKKI